MAPSLVVHGTKYDVVRFVTVPSGMLPNRQRLGRRIGLGVDDRHAQRRSPARVGQRVLHPDAVCEGVAPASIRGPGLIDEEARTKLLRHPFARPRDVLGIRLLVGRLAGRAEIEERPVVEDDGFPVLEPVQRREIGASPGSCWLLLFASLKSALMFADTFPLFGA